MTPPSIILYAEDERDDVFFLECAFQIAGSQQILKAVPDGEQAIQYLAGEGAFADRSRHPLPALVLLDINIPKKNGFDVLNWIRQQPALKFLPVLMFTSSTREEDRDNARRFGADDYLLKPADPLKLTEIVRTLHERWLASASPTSVNPTV